MEASVGEVSSSALRSTEYTESAATMSSVSLYESEGGIRVGHTLDGSGPSRIRIQEVSQSEFEQRSHCASLVEGAPEDEEQGDDYSSYRSKSGDTSADEDKNSRCSSLPLNGSEEDYVDKHKLDEGEESDVDYVVEDEQPDYTAYNNSAEDRSIRSSDDNTHINGSVESPRVCLDSKSTEQESVGYEPDAWDVAVNMNEEKDLNSTSNMDGSSAYGNQNDAFGETFAESRASAAKDQPSREDQPETATNGSVNEDAEADSTATKDDQECETPSDKAEVGINAHACVREQYTASATSESDAGGDGSGSGDDDDDVDAVETGRRTTSEYNRAAGVTSVSSFSSDDDHTQHAMGQQYNTESTSESALTQQEKRRITKRLMKEVNLEDTLAKYRGLAPVTSAYPDVRQMGLPSTPLILAQKKKQPGMESNEIYFLADREYMAKLEATLEKQYQMEMDKKEEERADLERQRMRRLLVEGVIGPEDLKDEGRSKNKSHNSRKGKKSSRRSGSAWRSKSAPEPKTRHQQATHGGASTSRTHAQSAAPVGAHDRKDRLPSPRGGYSGESQMSMMVRDEEDRSQERQTRFRRCVVHEEIGCTCDSKVPEPPREAFVKRRNDLVYTKLSEDNLTVEKMYTLADIILPPDRTKTFMELDIERKKAAAAKEKRRMELALAGVAR